MKSKKMLAAIVGGISILVPAMITSIIEYISKEQEMDEIANRVVKKIKEEESNDSKSDDEKKTEEKD